MESQSQFLLVMSWKDTNLCIEMQNTNVMQHDNVERESQFSFWIKNSISLESIWKQNKIRMNTESKG